MLALTLEIDMTLTAQVIEALRANGHAIDTEVHKVRLTQTPNMWPLNGSVLVDGRVAFDYFCRAHGGGVDVCVAE
jgi:hypothetical protein